MLGVRWTDDETDWGCGEGFKPGKERLARHEELTMPLLRNPEHMGFCYIQLTGVEQEQKGLLCLSPSAHFPPEVIREINRRRATIEE